MDGIRLRPERDDDLAFVHALYATTRADEMARLADWTAEQKQAFVAQQFHAQHSFYQQQYPDARYHVIERDGVRIGRLYVHATDDELRLMDITLVPEARGQGLGTALVCELQDEARTRGVPLGLYVEASNPAQRLYARLGFRYVADEGFYQLLRWEPTAIREAAGPAADLN